jgi:hypothetical protein
MLLTLMLLSFANCLNLIMHSHRGHSGYEPRGIAKGSPAAKAQSMEARAHGGAVPKGGLPQLCRAGPPGTRRAQLEPRE